MKNNIFALDTVHKQIAAMLIATVLMWAVGAPLWMVSRANASQLISVSDLISDSDKNVVANHTISFTMSTAIASSTNPTITITFDSAGDAFTLPAGSYTDMDVTVGGTDVTLGGTQSGTTWGAVFSPGSPDTIVLTVGDNGVSAGEEVVLEIGTNATYGATGSNQITNPNPASAGGVGTSYTIDVAVSGGGDSGQTRVAIIDDVTMTASVDTILTFNIYGVASSTAINGAQQTYASSTATSMAFGTLTSGSPKVLGQRLTVATNAINGYSVTVVQDQNLTSASGADIDLFIEGSKVASGTTWQAPVANVSNENTWGHYGITSSDATLSGGDDFGNALFRGDFASTTPLEVLYHNGPSDGTGVTGEGSIAIEIEINNLQEAANDYSNTLTYVCTPVF